MKINYININNIGPYLGEHHFDLNTNSKKNIVLIGGKNGAGKTTFLKAIKYGLFGSFSLGFKTDTESYFSEIRSMLNNQATSNFYIEIGFEYVENFETKYYRLRRSWFKNDSSLVESILVYKNDSLLDEYNTKELLDKIRALTSPKLINSFIFDGEKIASIIERDEVSSYLEEIFNSIFTIDMLQQTKRDLLNYLDKKSIESNTKTEVESIKYITDITRLKNELKSTEASLSEYVKTKSNLLIMKKNNMDNFYRLGGLTKKQQEAQIKKINNFNIEKDEMSKTIKTYIESDLPIFMNLNLLEDAICQANGERQARFPKYLDEIENVVQLDLSDIRKKLLNKIVNVELIHGINDDEIEKITDKILTVTNTTATIKPYLKSKFIKNDEYKIMKQNLLDNENIDKIQFLLQENESIDKNLKNLELLISDLEKKILDLTKELEVSYILYQKVINELNKNSLADYSFIVGQKVYDICDKFIERMKKYKLKSISNTALEIFNDTIRKKNFITKLEIKEDFDLVLYNSKGTNFNPKILSAGEMQILVSSLIWAMFRISGRREMFIFDTPLARLDTENRQNFISKIISTISSQVVILSTDSEFVGSNLEIIDSIVYDKYLLSYDPLSATTTVLKSYFDGGVTNEC